LNSLFTRHYRSRGDRQVAPAAFFNQWKHSDSLVFFVPAFSFSNVAVYLWNMNLMRFFAACSFVFSMLFLSVPDLSAAAERAWGLKLNWQTPSQCGTTEDIQNKAIGILGDRTDVAAFSTLNGSIVDAAGRWLVTLNVPAADKTYTRSVTVNTCEAALEVSSLLIALVIDPSHVLSSQDPKIQSSIETLQHATGDEAGIKGAESGAAPSPAESGQGPKAAPLSPPPPPEPTDSRPPETKKRSIFSTPLPPRLFALGVSFVSDVGTVSSFAPGVALSATFRLRIFATELSIRYLPPRDVDVAGSDGAVWSPQLLGISLGAGASWSIKRIRLTPLVGICGQGIFAESKGVTAPSRATIWIASAWLGVTLDGMITDWFGLRLQPTLHYLFTRPQFVIDDIGRVYQPSPVAGVFTIGFIFAF
jgi:hypothetical protein